MDWIFRDDAHLWDHQLSRHLLPSMSDRLVALDTVPIITGPDSFVGFVPRLFFLFDSSNVVCREDPNDSIVADDG